MEYQDNEHSKSTNEQKLKQATIQVIIGYLGLCSGYDAQTREELIEELLELEAA